MSYGKDAYDRRTRRRQEIPVRNQVHCPRAGRSKLQFGSESSATRHLQFLDPADFPRGDMPIRSYHCRACQAWHVTSQEDRSKKAGVLPGFEGVLPEFQAIMGL